MSAAVVVEVVVGCIHVVKYQKNLVKFWIISAEFTIQVCTYCIYAAGQSTCLTVLNMTMLEKLQIHKNSVFKNHFVSIRLTLYQ